MLTLFTIPKSFRGQIAIIQLNSIQSWLHLHPECEIILFGDEPGIAEVAKEFDLIHIPHINKTEYGTPLLDFVFQRAQELASNNLLCYVNSDIIFMSDLLQGLKEIGRDKFLAAGQRFDLDLQTAWDFDSAGWEERLRDLLAREGSLHCTAGIDYFAFTKGSLGQMPPFAVGREGWDNWLIYDARARGMPVIDTTQRITAVHQNHGYSHVPMRSGLSWEGPESDRNLKLIGRRIYQCSLEDADWEMGYGGPVRRPLSSRELFRRLTIALPPALHSPLEEFFIWQHQIRHGVKLRKV